MEKVLNFKFVKYPYKTQADLPDIEDVLDSLKTAICEKNDSVISDLITEIADDSVDIYTDSLVGNCSSVAFMEYIDESIKEFGHAENHEKQLRLAEFCYYYDSLNENFEAVVRNALCEYISKQSVIINGSAEEVLHIVGAVEKYVSNAIDTFSADTNLYASAILDVFERDLINRLEAIEEYSKDVKIKITENDDEEAAITGLCIEPGKTPYTIKIPTNNMLGFLQGVCDGYIEVLPLFGNRSDGLEIDMIVNEEGKINNLPHNRIITEDDLFNNHSAEVVDIVCGNAVIVAADSNGEWVSLPDDEIEKWNNRFYEPTPAFIGSLYLDDENIEIPDFIDIERGIIDLNEHGRGDDDEER